ncbi:hypothetical protein QJS10_CPB18g01788 [Acorus calamus]|uniref:Uncharacterized protein n=1 Tax=Acorus calamus TaxID=4465 RepID=A0AAV9CQ21_ACOCL|nr:hypothetical protein QJS10_CPB18g01788 [Acorus calamus]
MEGNECVFGAAQKAIIVVGYNTFCDASWLTVEGVSGGVAGGSGEEEVVGCEDHSQRPHDNLSFDNITDLKDSKVDFGSTAPGATLNSSYVKSVESAYSESTIAFHGDGQPVESF